MKLHRTFGKIQMRSDFFVGKTLQHPVQDFFFAPGESNRTLGAVTGLQDFLSLLGKSRRLFGSAGTMIM